MTKLFTVAEMMGRDLARRRVALALLAFVPLLFYMARHDGNPEKAIRFAGLGLAWAVSTAGLFLSNTTKAVERRLRQTGYRPAHLYLGTLTALLTLGAVLATVYWVLIYLDQDNLARPGAVAIEFGLTIVVAAPLGLLISAVAPHDLEGTLVLISITGLQFLVEPDQKLGKALPFWSTQQVGTFGLDGGDPEYLRKGLLHGALYCAGLILVTAVLASVRLRQRKHMRIRAAVR
ncbi:hypothetical protein [Micromonospora wenchangensis]|uniref:hypothetical protein n=1 Tax=Micromonospora wenchangensis TaxID=1185415 RepID=UPI003D71A5C8